MRGHLVSFNKALLPTVYVSIQFVTKEPYE
jgi:hypothetical protein